MTATRGGQRSWHVKQLLDLAPGLQALGNTLADLADAGHPVVVTTADLKYSNGTVLFEQRHPGRFVQFGIAEQNMATASAGLATTGMIPYAVSFASFIALLCCEQIRTDAAYTNLPVRFVGTHAGITLGFYGSSHHATEDLAITRAIANLDVVAPADATALSAALTATVEHPRPLYFRIGRGRDPEVYGGGINFELGRAIVHAQGADLTLIATGSAVHPALEAASALRAEGLAVGVIDMHTLSPFDSGAVRTAAAASARLMTVEEHNVTGGLGSAVAEVLADAGAATPLHRHGIRDEYSLIGAPTHLYAHYRLDSAGVAAEARELLARD